MGRMPYAANSQYTVGRQSRLGLGTAACTVDSLSHLWDLPGQPLGHPND